MSPRRNSRRTGTSGDSASGPGAFESGGPSPFERIEEGSDGSWIVRSITGSSSTKAYRCPGCDQEIRPATPHVVAWPQDNIDQRRHWHTTCWRARLHRRARPLRSGRAPWS